MRLLNLGVTSDAGVTLVTGSPASKRLQLGVMSMQTQVLVTADSTQTTADTTHYSVDSTQTQITP